MPALILINGPAASGKSTLAQRLVDARRFALNLDIDVIRGQLGGWLDAPIDAGIASRQLALAMAQTHLGAGHDVVVPQLLAKEAFIDQLAQTALDESASFVEVVLTLDRQAAIDAFHDRSSNPSTQAHRDAAALVKRSGTDDPIAALYDDLQQLMIRRPAALQVPVELGDIDATYAALTAALADAGVDWWH